IATIDDRHAQAAVDVARIGFQAADERAKDEIEKVFARLSAEVAQKDYQMSLQANASGMKVVSEIELEKKRLDWNRARLQIEKAEKDRVLARLEANVKQAELDAAEIAMDRRTITAPFDGEVQLVLLHDSEWVNPGDPILRLVQFDVMYVEGYVRADRFDPAELQGRPVTVTVKQARNRQVAIPGHVRWVNQTVVDTTEGYAEYLVQAEVKNTREGEFWLVRPGIRAAMTIHVNLPPVTQSAVPPTAQR
ncbi:MAG TPA: HlyD family efflux transporter periplasmic adaptor subunit, partial [Lacipirellulaceae bacterium]|nr:HlyD family efflux transporter periplasmic adaptor subunit [Lacipirellulaceae bacterium]